MRSAARTTTQSTVGRADTNGTKCPQSPSTGGRPVEQEVHQAPQHDGGVSISAGREDQQAEAMRQLANQGFDELDSQARVEVLRDIVYSQLAEFSSRKDM